MQFKGMNLCDFCFAEIPEGSTCEKCGLSHETYHLDAGLLPPGTNLLGKYIIGRVLGRGGFGATYLAYSSDLNKVVAIKEYFPINIAYRGKGEDSITIVSDDKKAVFDKGAKRFFDEAKTISVYNKNDNIVSVYEFFYANNTVYYSMEYLEGVDLKKYISNKGGRLKEAEVISILKSLCNALMVVHSTQTLHRDISPDNIFMCLNGKVKLIDFGAAKQVVSDENQSYSVVVKQGFAPSEQYTRKGNQGVWTDIYAVGATMYYALTGKVPPDAIDRVENPELDFSPVENVISKEIIAIVQKCMQTRYADRYQSAIQLLADLDRIYVSPIEETVDEKAFAKTEGKVEKTTLGMGKTSPVDLGNAYKRAKKFKNSGVSVPFFKKKAFVISAACSLAVCLILGTWLFVMNNSKSGSSGTGGGGGGGTTDITQEINNPSNESKINNNKPENTVKDESGKNKPAQERDDSEKAKGDKTGTDNNKKNPSDNNKKNPSDNNKKKCSVCGSTAHTVHPTCKTCGSTAHTVHPKTEDKPAKCSVCGSTAHTVHPQTKATCPVCGSTDHTTHPQTKEKCPVCGSTDHTTHPKPKLTCPVCGSSAHTVHPSCPTCGSTDHTTHPLPTCPVCGSTAHTVHP